MPVPGTGREGCAKKDVRILLKLVKKKGGRYERRNDGHYWVENKQGVGTKIASTPSSISGARADLKKRGII